MNSNINTHVVEFLNDNFNIPVDDYFKLSEEEKIYISDIVTKSHIKIFDMNRNMVEYYLEKMLEYIKLSEQLELYESCDITQRAYDNLYKKYLL